MNYFSESIHVMDGCAGNPVKIHNQYLLMDRCKYQKRNNSRLTPYWRIALIQREPFDYTKWRQKIDEEISIEEISQRAMSMRKNSNKEGP